MIISASYKTDIPAFYGQWFVNRLRAGYCMMRNPMNRQVIRVPMTRDEVDGVVFWTKNFRPFVKHLDEVAMMGMPFTVQYTINSYAACLEQAVVDWHRSVEAVTELASRFGPRCVVWRYDTIIYSRFTPREFHIENFRRIADSLRGLSDEVVISFMQLYRKTVRNMDAMAEDTGNSWWDPSVEEKRDLARELCLLAAQRGMVLTICTQPELITVQSPSRCIDAKRLSDVAGRPIRAKTAGNRPGCECAASKDIGDYDTCPHGCVYCYAVRSQDVAIRRFKTHDPDSEFLFSEISPDNSPSQPERQLSLFERDNETSKQAGQSNE